MALLKAGYCSSLTSLRSWLEEADVNGCLGGPGGPARIPAPAPVDDLGELARIRSAGGPERIPGPVPVGGPGGLARTPGPGPDGLTRIPGLIPVGDLGGPARTAGPVGGPGGLARAAGDTATPLRAPRDDCIPPFGWKVCTPDGSGLDGAPPRAPGADG